jgi:hypothetical protein
LWILKKLVIRDDQHELSFSISREQCKQLVKLLVTGAVVLSAISLIANTLNVFDFPGSRMLVGIFSVNEENSVATWWSTIVLAALGVLTALVGNFTSGNGRRKAIWYLLAFGFVFLSLDEGAMLHERFGYLINVDGQFHHARWIILWLPLALAIGGLALSMIWRISHRLVIGLGIGAIVFLAGAVGMEILISSFRFETESEVAVAH